jgi:L-glyceraldehyde 3-phosphate reductase
LVGVSRPEQLDDNVAAVRNTTFSTEELQEIEGILKG